MYKVIQVNSVALNEIFKTENLCSTIGTFTLFMWKLSLNSSEKLFIQYNFYEMKIRFQ